MKPNIIYILADDMGYGDVSHYNPNCKAPTPYIDRLANEGMKFTDAHTSSAVCTPTRYSILTGRYNWRSWLDKKVLSGTSPTLMEKNRVSVPSLLQDNGYKTYCVGKWHLGLDWTLFEGEEPIPRSSDMDLSCTDDIKKIDFTKPVKSGVNDVGFAYSYIIPGSLDLPPYVYLENELPNGIPSETSKIGVDNEYLMRRGPAVPGMQAIDTLPHFTDKVSEIIKKQETEQPFFIYFPLTAPHTPIVPAKEFQGKTDIGPYGDFVTQVDAVVGAVIQSLEEKGILDETMIIFTADNGASPAAKLDNLSKLGHEANRPWRGAKADLYEGGHRVPFVIRYPGQIKPKSICNETICTTDFLATVASILDVELPEDAGEDSYDMSPLFTGEPLEQSFREATVHHSVHGHFAIRKGPWKLLEAHGSGGWSFPTEEEAKDLPKRQLYNLDKDPGERTNLLDAYPDVAQELVALLNQYRTQNRSAP